MAAGPDTFTDEAIDVLISSMSNDCVRWDGTVFGLHPELTGNSARQLLEVGERAVPKLIEALGEPSKFVAAHVILTLVTGVEYASSPWNGLNLELSAENVVSVDPHDRAALIDQWDAWRRARGEAVPRNGSP